MSLRVNSSGQSKTVNVSLPQNIEKKDSEFSNILSHTSSLQSQELELFLRRLDEQGKKLSETMSVQELTEFKNMVKRFLKSTLGKSRSMQEETIWDYRGQPKVMARVTKIDRALEELGEQVLSSQAETLKILAKIDEIKGLIIDLFA
ncbi:MAG: YaaR family protein [Peptococcaceae bacterium]|nr:YaaR family protein [Peptococcaceae bacterium]